MSEKNRVKFGTVEEAVGEGYRKAGDCGGWRGRMNP
jgi:hypothetical protein